MRKLSAKWGPKYLNADQKCMSDDIKSGLNRFAARKADFMARLVTIDETRPHHYDPPYQSAINGVMPRWFTVSKEVSTSEII